MKRTLLVFAVLAGALSLLWAGITQAANVRTGQSPMVMNGETIDGTLYAAGSNVTIDGTVAGDLICAAESVQVNGAVQGDVLCAAQTITVKGVVDGNVRAIGQTVTVDGSIDGSVSVVGQNATLGAAAKVGRDVTMVGQYLTAGGTVNRDVSALGNDFKVTGSVGRDLEVTGEAVSLGANSKVARNFTYTSETDAKLENGAQVDGTTDHRYPERTENRVNDMAAYAGSVVWGFAGLLVVGLAMLLVVPRLAIASGAAVQKAPLATLGYGLVGFIVPPFLAVFLAITFIGVPLAFVMILGWLTLLIVSTVFTAQALGRVIVTKMQWHGALQHLSALLVGLLVLFLLTLIPFVGTFIAFVAIIWGIGAFWYVVLKNMRPKQRPQLVGESAPKFKSDSKESGKK